MSAVVVDAGDGLPLTVPALLAARAGRGDHALLICDDDVLTYTDAVDRSAALAKALLAAGLGRGSRVGLFFPNGSAFVVSWLAAARIGAVSLPFSTFSTAHELGGMLRGADVELVLSADGYRGRDFVAVLAEAVPGHDPGAHGPILSPAVPSLRRVVFEHDAARFVGAGATVSDAVLAAAEAAVRPGDRMVVVHTSGSTSEPKGVVHQHGPLLRHLDNLNEMRRYDQHDVLFSNSPFFWVGGFAYSLLGTLAAGATLVCTNATDAGEALDTLERARPTMVNGFAQSVAHLGAHPSFPSRDLSSIRRGNLWPIMPPETRAADPELRHNLLGMTEAGSVCLASDDEGDQPEHRRGSFGRPVPGFEARIVDVFVDEGDRVDVFVDEGDRVDVFVDEGDRADVGTVADCAVGVAGELWFRGPFLMEGYLGRERGDTFEPDGWYRTGDVFHVDAEGFFHFHGRRGDMIKTAGANVSPREVEAAIADLCGLVAHVIGVDDAERGQVVVAVVRVLPNQAAPDPAELRTGLRARLSAFKVPRHVIVLADAAVPMLSSGKVDGRALREWVASHLAGADGGGHP